MRDLLDPEAVARTAAELQRLAPSRQCRRADHLHDALRVLGPLTREELLDRTVAESRPAVDAWIAELQGTRRIIAVRWAGVERYAAIEDAARLRDALGAALPPGLPMSLLESPDHPLTGLIHRFARTHTPFAADDVSHALGVDRAVARGVLDAMVDDGTLVRGELRPLGSGGAAPGPDYCDRDVLRLLKRRSLAALRAEVEPVDRAGLSRFLPAWQGMSSPSRGVDGLLRVLEQLAGLQLPASALETLILPARVRDYAPALLDELMSAGEVIWQGHGALAGHDGWISLHPVDTAHLTLAPPADEPVTDPLQAALLEALGAGGAHFFTALQRAAPDAAADQLQSALWDLVWSGRVSGDTIAPLRARLAGGRTTHRARRRPGRGRYAGLRGITSRPAQTGQAGRAAVPATVAGRWSLLPAAEADPTARALATAEVLLDRYGVVTRGVVSAEGVTGGFSAVYRVLTAAEDAGRVRRGYFVEGLGAAQFATAGAIDRLRASVRAVTEEPDEGSAHPPAALVLAACDPANPFGAALDWPAPPEDGSGHRPGRKAGALVVMWDGALVLFVERGGKSLLVWDDRPHVLSAAAKALAALVGERRLSGLTVHSVNGTPALQTDHPVVDALRDAGFHLTTRGLRIR